MSENVRERIHAFLDDSGLEYEVLDCDPELADTAVFCEHYGVPLDCSVNCILVKAKTGGERFAACVLLATTRLDVNKVVRKRLEARRVSFASADETRELTGMELGGVSWPRYERELRRARVLAAGSAAGLALLVLESPRFVLTHRLPSSSSRMAITSLSTRPSLSANRWIRRRPSDSSSTRLRPPPPVARNTEPVQRSATSS